MKFSLFSLGLELAAAMGGAGCGHSAAESKLHGNEESGVAEQEGAGGTSDPAKSEINCSRNCLDREYANWPMPTPPTLPGKHPSSLAKRGELVVENVTGLEWSAGFGGLITHADARRHCDELEMDGFADFRLPTLIEMVTLIDRTRVPSIDGSFFPATPADYFWTDSVVFDSPELAYSVYFGLGETGVGRRDQASGYVRCVRGGDRVSSTRLRRDGDLVHDDASGLIWEAHASSSRLTSDGARLFCAERTAPDGGALRLPSDGELRTLFDPRREAASNPAGPRWIGRFWALVVTGLRPMTVDFTSGRAELTPPTETHFALCLVE